MTSMASAVAIGPDNHRRGVSVKWFIPWRHGLQPSDKSNFCRMLRPLVARDGNIAGHAAARPGEPRFDEHVPITQLSVTTYRNATMGRHL